MPPVAALAGAGLAVALLIGAAPATPAGGQPAGPGRVSLASQTAWTRPGAPFELQVDVAAVPGAEDLDIAVTVHQAVTSRSQFRQTLDGRLLGGVVLRQRTPLVDAATDPAGTVGITVPAELPRAGVHPVRVELVDAATGALVDGFTTHLVRARDDDAPPLAVAWLQPVVAPLLLRPDGTVELDADAQDDLAAIVAVLRASDVPLTLAPRPETLDGLRTVAPHILADLAASVQGRQVVAEPYVDVDVEALVDAGLDHELAAQREWGAEVVETALGVTPDTDTWVGPALDPDALDALADVDRLVVPEDALAPLDRSLTLANPFVVKGVGGGHLTAAATDAGLSTHFGAGDDQVLAAHHLLADLAVLAYDAPGLSRGVVVRPPPTWEPSLELLDTALGALHASPVVRPVTLDQLFEEVPVATVAGDELVRALGSGEPPGPDLPVEQLRQTRNQVTSFAVMAQGGGTMAELLRRLVLVAQAKSLAGPERLAYLDGAARLLEGHLGQVGVLGDASFRLTSRRASIPLTLVNRLDVDVRVSLLLESDKLDFVGPGGSTTGRAEIPLTLGPGNTPIVVPVEARASGDFPLLATLRSPDGRLEVGTAQITVRSTFLSGVGILLSAGAGLFLLVWWAGHWRTTRRARRLVGPRS